MSLLTRRIKKQLSFQQGNTHLLSEESPFAIQEAYKTIRTNIMFSLPEEKCKKIVVTSSVQAEAKSTTVVNLGIAFAQNNSRVLVIDCDLRRPVISSQLNVAQTPGLSNYLVGLCRAEDAIRHLSNGLDVIPSGDIPPNPSELLGSEKMQKLLKSLEDSYEYILIDSPPVTAVSDAVILANQTSGVIVIARQGFATQETVSETLEKLRFSEANILGFILTDVKNEKRRHFGKGNYGYQNRYSYAYSSAGTSSDKKV